MREFTKKEYEIVAQRHKTICINRYLTQPDDIFTDRYLAFHPIHTPEDPENCDGVFVRMTNAGMFKIFMKLHFAVIMISFSFFSYYRHCVFKL